MALQVDPSPSRADDDPVRGSRSLSLAGRVLDSEAVVTVGLVNNMPDSALEGTEIQFTSLLKAASGPLTVNLRITALPEVDRGPQARTRIAEHYWPLDDFLASPLDALIVTGTEPRAPSLRAEPYWDRLADLATYAEEHTISTIWSCLAAHAAVLLLDGIERQRRSQKLCGVYGHTLPEAHPLTAGLGAPYRVPQSRWNDLPIAQLRTAGYAILSEANETGADAFVKHRRSLFVFFQGHPEYEQKTLLKEFQRDVARFIGGQQLQYPSMPMGYFGTDAEALLAAFRRELDHGRLADPLAAFPFTAVAATLTNTWGASAARLFGNWLTFVAGRKRSTGRRDRFAV